MVASIEYRLTEEEYVAGQQVVMAHLKAEFRKTAWRGWVQLTPLVVAIALAYLLNPAALDAILLALIILLLGSWALNSRYVRHWHRTTFEPAIADHKTGFNDQGITSARGAEKSHYPWTAVRNVQELPNALVLIFLGWGHLLIPNRAFSSDGDRAALLETLRTSSPNLRPDLPIAGATIGKAALLLAAGAFAAGVQIFLLLNVATILLLFHWIDTALAENRATAVVWGGGLATAIFLGLAILSGAMIYRALSRLHDRRPGTAKLTAGAPIASLAALATVYVLLTCCRC